MSNSTITSTSVTLTAINFTNSASFNTTNNVASTSTKGVAHNNLHDRSQATIITQVTLLVILGVVIVLGNLVSIVTFLKTQSLRRRCHYLIISLLFADVLVGVNDFMAAHFFLTVPHFNMFVVCLEFVDTFSGIASILTLSAIAVERSFAIYFPFRHRTVRHRFYMTFIVFPWFAAIAVSVLHPVAVFSQNKSVYNIYKHQAFVIASLALAAILTSYVSIGFKMRRNSIHAIAQNQNRALRERKLAVTLLIVTLASLVTWLPLQCLLVVLYLCKTCSIPHFNVFFIMKFLQFLNSGVNVFIYIIRIPEFRQAFVALLRNQNNLNIVHPATMEMQVPH